MPQFTFFTGPKPWETELIVVTTCVGPINVSSPAFVFAHITGRRVWYNYDGSEMVQPLVCPQATRVNTLPEELHGINDDKDIMYQVEHHGGM